MLLLASLLTCVVRRNITYSYAKCQQIYPRNLCFINDLYLIYTILQVVESYKDFAFSDYARVGRALALYEVGDREEAIAEMEDVSISLKGYPGLHMYLHHSLYILEPCMLKKEISQLSFLILFSFLFLFLFLFPLPEVHAALAAALYADKHAPLLAENQFTIATLLDPHFTDLSYVRDSKHWPPSLISSLQHFITLS